jgi:hypothetical protein
VGPVRADGERGDRLIELLIIEMLRMKVDDGEIDAGLLNTLGDPGISAALTALPRRTASSNGKARTRA